MSAASQQTTQHPQAERSELQLHEPAASQAKTSEDATLAGMLLACTIFTLAFGGFVVVPYVSQWLTL